MCVNVVYNSFSPYVANRKNDNFGDVINQLRVLVDQNYSTEVLRRKNMRLRFRALRGSLVNWPIQRDHSKTVSKTVMVTKTRTDANGNTQTYQEAQTITRSVTVRFQFHNATFVIANGFRVQLHYNDGYGENPISHDGWRPHSWSNEFHNVCCVYVCVCYKCHALNIM